MSKGKDSIPKEGLKAKQRIFGRENGRSLSRNALEGEKEVDILQHEDSGARFKATLTCRLKSKHDLDRFCPAKLGTFFNNLAKLSSLMMRNFLSNLQVKAA